MIVVVVVVVEVLEGGVGGDVGVWRLRSRIESVEIYW
jgi:hypothetical protein